MGEKSKEGNAGGKPEGKGRSRRATRRLPTQAMITYRVEGHEYGNLAVDVSEDGIFIRTLFPHAVGTKLDLTLKVPPELGGFSVELAGEVVRVVDGENPRENGMGIHFTSVCATEPDAVRYLVSRIFRFEKLRDSGEFKVADAT